MFETKRSILDTGDVVDRLTVADEQDLHFAEVVKTRAVALGKKSE